MTRPANANCPGDSRLNQSPPTSRRAHLASAAGFLRSIGLEVQEQPGAEGFLSGVRIAEGRLLYDPDRAEVSDLLHEAGHMAVLPSRYRKDASDNILDIQLIMLDEVEELVSTGESDPDAPLVRAALQAGETESTAWAYAAGVASGMPVETIIQDHEYDGEGRALRRGLSKNIYVGINGLVAGGMCRSVSSYPNLTRWLQE